MDATPKDAPAGRAARMGWLDYLLGGAAVLISAISLQVAVSANRTQERMMAASTWPFVQYGTGNRLDDGASAITFNLHNAGIGPARIHTVQVYYQDAAQPDAGALLRACCQASGDLITITSNPERVLVPGEEVSFLRYDQASADAAVWSALNRERFAVRLKVCYCSVLEDCWMLDTSAGDPKPTRQCPTIPKAERFQG